jgi:hypothetical protein
MGYCRTVEVVDLVSGIEVLVMFITLYREDPARNISERHKIV